MGKAKGHDYLALLARAEGNVEEALTEWTAASHYYMDTNNPFRAACVKANQAQLYLDQGELDTALTLSIEALSELELITAHQAAVGVRGIIAQVHLAKGHLAEAERWAQAVVQSNVREYSRVGFFILGKIKLRRGFVEDASHLIEACVRDCEEAQDDTGLAQSMHVLMQIYEQQGRATEAAHVRDRLKLLAAA